MVNVALHWVLDNSSLFLTDLQQDLVDVYNGFGGDILRDRVCIWDHV